MHSVDEVIRGGRGSFLPQGGERLRQKRPKPSNYSREERVFTLGARNFVGVQSRQAASGWLGQRLGCMHEDKV